MCGRNSLVQCARECILVCILPSTDWLAFCCLFLVHFSPTEVLRRSRQGLRCPLHYSRPKTCGHGWSGECCREGMSTHVYVCLVCMVHTVYICCVLLVATCGLPVHMFYYVCVCRVGLGEYSFSTEACTCYSPKRRARC